MINASESLASLRDEIDRLRLAARHLELTVENLQSANAGRDQVIAMQRREIDALKESIRARCK
jgi:archaellum component FlaC